MSEMRSRLFNSSNASQKDSLLYEFVPERITILAKFFSLSYDSTVSYLPSSRMALFDRNGTTYVVIRSNVPNLIICRMKYTRKPITPQTPRILAHGVLYRSSSC